MQNKQFELYLDLELLEGYIDSLGKTIVEQMFTLYCQQVEIYLKDIESACIDESEVNWQMHCHKMKGATASVGMYQLHERLKQLEKTEATIEQKSVLLEELKAANKQAIFTFKNWLESF